MGSAVSMGDAVSAAPLEAPSAVECLDEESFDTPEIGVDDDFVASPGKERKGTNQRRIA